MVSKILEITFTLVLVYLVLSMSDGFSEAITAIGNVYSKSVKTLQAR